MDISKASNFERFIYDVLDRNGDNVRDLWAGIEQGSGFDVKESMNKVKSLGFVSGSSNHEARMQTIRATNAKYGVLVDTHTADGIKVALEHKEKGTPMVVLETALAAKFEDALVEALGDVPPRPESLNGLEDLPQKFTVMDSSTKAIKDFIAKTID
jgi:threonine synthase